MTIRMNEVYLCLACYGQKLIFLFWNRDKDKHKLSPSKHLLVLNTSSRRLQDMSWTRLQRNNFTSSKTSWRCLEDLLEDEKLLHWRHLQDVLKTSGGHILKTTSRRLEGKQNVYWWYLHLTNLNVYLTNLCFTNLHLTNLRWIQNALLRTQ